VGVPYSFASASAVGNPTASFLVSAGALPPGLLLAGTTGVVSGTPSAVGVSTFTVTATNAAGAVSKSYTVTVAAVLAATGASVWGPLGISVALLLAGLFTVGRRRRASAAQGIHR
jgi:hypothetical protein